MLLSLGYVLPMEPQLNMSPAKLNTRQPEVKHGLGIHMCK